ncbi:MAG TPA: hypothetical protein VFT49_01135 [Candidatus Saccharimonadales bacterium]|nr:hypothetical protein [Candidatus Saccharimonadales bacterium]
MGEALEFDRTNEGDRAVVSIENIDPRTLAAVLREKKSTGSPDGESGFIPEGAIGKTVGLSYERPEGV